MKFDPPGAQPPELAREIPIGEQFHGLQKASQTCRRDDMHNRAVVAGDGDQRTGLGRADRGRGFTLEILYAVCIFHMNKVYLIVGTVNAKTPGRGGG